MIDPATLTILASVVLKIWESMDAAKRPTLTDTELDALRAVSQAKLDDFLKATEGK